jgi:hypothetical protein
LYGALDLWRQAADAGKVPPVPRRIEELRYLLARDLEAPR